MVQIVVEDSESVHMHLPMISECHGFENPCGFLIRVHKGTGRGTNYGTLQKPVPICADPWVTDIETTYFM